MYCSSSSSELEGLGVVDVGADELLLLEVLWVDVGGLLVVLEWEDRLRC